MIMGGIEQSFFPIGKSTFFGQYFEGNYAAPTSNPANPGVNSTPLAAQFAGFGVTKSVDLKMWGIGFNQNIAAAAMDIYIQYNNQEFELTNTAGVKANVNDIQTVITGARLQF
jgi:hypothetical protein